MSLREKALGAWKDLSPRNRVFVAVGAALVCLLVVLMLLGALITAAKGGPVKAEITDCYFDSRGWANADLTLTNNTGDLKDVYLEVVFTFDGDQIGDGNGTVTLTGGRSASTTVDTSQVADWDWSRPDDIGCEVVTIHARPGL